MHLVEKSGQLYVRFGEIPKSGKSGIGRSPNWIHAMQRTSDEEAGVSCYWATYHKETDQWVLEDVGNVASVVELIAQADAGRRKIYVVTGDELDEQGTDGEPLLQNVKIVKEIPSIQNILVPGCFDGKEVEEQIEYSAKELWLIHPDGEVKYETDTTITEADIDDLLGWTASFNGIPGGDNEIFFRTTDEEGKEENPKATAELNRIMDRDIGRQLKGRAIILKDWSKRKIHR